MKGMTIKAMTQACHGIYHGDEGAVDIEISAITTDSRKIQKNGMFIAICGEKSDGHDYIGKCFDDGALCCISERELPGESRPYIQVESSLTALKQLAAYYRQQLDIKVVGITGSVGKTSTKETIASVLAQKYKVKKTQGNFNNELGVPLTIFRIGEEHEVAVVEMGMNHYGEMHRLSKMVRPTHCLFTNIGVAHLEFLGSRDGILKAKCEMFDYAADDVKAFVNGDDDKLITLKDIARTFGMDPSRDVWADSVEKLGFDGVRCRIHTDTKNSFETVIPLPGTHMVYNAMAGTCIGLALGLSIDEIRAGIESLKPLPGRSNILHTEHYTLLDDCYNANPASMMESLNVLDDTHSRKVAILGDMGELGPQSDSLHASVGEHLKNLHVDILVTIGTLSTALHDAAKKSAPQTRCLHFADVDSFLKETDKILKSGDAILVKASHSMGFTKIVEALQ